MSETEVKKLRSRQEINVEYTQLASQLGHNVFEIKRIHLAIKDLNFANEVIKDKMKILGQEKAADEPKA